jgi:PAS domain S-box-containing protein
VELTTNNIIFHGQKAVQVVLRDISERKHVEEELRNRQHEVTTLLDSLPAYAFFKDVNYRYITANQRFCNAIGYTKEAIVGKTDFDFFPKSFAEKLQKDDEKVITTGESIFIYEEQMIDQGKPITVDTRKVPLKDQYGKIVGLIGLAFDITERKTVEEAIKKYTKELEELNANKDKFFSIISHDLRSPFQGLLGLSNILAEEFDNLSLDEIRLFSSNIHNSTKNLFSLLENLLQWSRIQTGKLELKPVKTDLQEEILYNINLLKGNASKKNIEIINEITKSVFVYTDLNVLNSTLQNLISNAIKFTNPGGTITISMKTSEDFIELTVSDNGVGISKDNIEKLFRIDKQFTTPGTERESGTGLGLTICKELLEKQGCKIWVTSELGEGSNFSFTIPKFQE